MELIRKIDLKYEENLYDESKKRGIAESISFPKSEDEIKSILKETVQKKIPVTIQGGKSGICGGAVPEGGHILNLKNMNKILNFEKNKEEYFVTVEPGVTLFQLQETLRKKEFLIDGIKDETKEAIREFKTDKRKYIFPVEPTEESATLGGIISTDAKGICSDFYGSVKDYLTGLTLITASGDELEIERGMYRVIDGNIELPNGKNFKVPSIFLKTENEIDLLDLVIGSEGTLGIFSKLKVKILQNPEIKWALCFAMSEEYLMKFIENLRNTEWKDLGIAAAEYFDCNSLKLFTERRKFNSKLGGLPDFNYENESAVYIEIHGESEETVEETAGILMEIAIEAGCEEEKMWALTGDEGIEKFRALRHFVPESINSLIEEKRQLTGDIYKLSGDISFGNKSIKEVIDFYKKELGNEKIDYFIFGHILSSHFHINIVPKNSEEFQKGREFFKNWIKNAKGDGTTLFSEHGIGKIKREQFEEILSQKEIEELKNMKHIFDNTNLLGAGNKFR